MISANIGGTVVDESLASLSFYGFKLDRAGALSIENIRNGEAVVTLPSELATNFEDYKAWVWTEATLQFRFSDSGHLEMVIV